MRKLSRLAAIAAAASLSLAACSSATEAPNKQNSASDKSSTAQLVTLKVGASPVPHGEILTFVKDNLAQDAGIDLLLVEYTDYVQPNVALDAGDIDANYFQHLPYLEEEITTKGYSFQHSEGIHIEPMGIYSQKVKDVKDVPEGGTVVIPNDATNGGRALKLLAANGVITVDTKVDNPTVADVTENPKNLKITESDAAAVPVQLADADLAVINSNFALENKLNPSKDALVLESGENNPYSNVLVWNAQGDKEKLDAIAQLDKLLHSQAVADFITSEYQGQLIPAF